MNISQADLPVSESGRIYHLNLKPEELADNIITVGDPDRVSMVSGYFDTIEHQIAHREFVTHTGFLNGKRVSVVSTGIGTSNIDIVINELDALKNIDFKTRQPKEKLTSLQIVRFGTTGGLQSHLAIGELVVTCAAIGLDNLLSFYQSAKDAEAASLVNALSAHIPDLPSRAYYFKADTQLVDKLASLGRVGITLTCPGFYIPQGRTLRAKPLIANLLTRLAEFEYQGQRILNFEMETAALIGLGQTLGHKVTALSVVLANRQQGTFAIKPEKLTDEMIESALKLLF